MQITDIHTHIYPDEIALKATNSVREFYQIGLDGEMDGTVNMLLSRGAMAGITKFVVLPVAIRPDRVQGINDFILQQTRLHRSLASARFTQKWRVSPKRRSGSWLWVFGALKCIRIPKDFPLMTPVCSPYTKPFRARSR